MVWYVFIMLFYPFRSTNKGVCIRQISVRVSLGNLAGDERDKGNFFQVEKGKKKSVLGKEKEKLLH